MEFDYFLIFLIFLWIGFVRTGLGFGGAALGLPLLLLIDDNPVYWLGIIGIHLLFFSALSLSKEIKNVDWSYLKKALIIILPTKLVGVFGLLSLPNDYIVLFIYLISLFYGILWFLTIKIKANSKLSDIVLLLIGGYVSGTSLTGAPLIVAVFMHNIVKNQLRNTLFVLWFVLVSIKLATFISFGVEIDYYFAIILIPIAFIGHLIGLKVHDYILERDLLFKKVIGLFLAIISGIYLIKILI
jgi:uncharacterized membrane protein YfcA